MAEAEAIQAFDTVINFVKFAIGIWVVIMIMLMVIRMGRLLDEFKKFYHWIYYETNLNISKKVKDKEQKTE
ncbi:hypothetical protein KAU34_03865 [candidate division WOR-3 bacterium]|nr:hypothetical protein [candidate division WOR-3 bacterium]